MAAQCRVSGEAELRSYGCFSLPRWAEAKVTGRSPPSEMVLGSGAILQVGPA